MFKKFKKKSLKAKIGIIAFIVFMIALVAYVLYANFKPEPLAEYEISDVAYGAITDTLDVSGTVRSEGTQSLTAIEGVTVEEVFVKVGDKVSKGDKLATFDATTVQSYLTQAEKDYKKALDEYESVKKSNADAISRKAELEVEINAKKAEISKLEKELEELQGQLENSTVQTRPLTQQEIDAVVENMRANGATEEEIASFTANAQQIRVPVQNGNSETQEKITQKTIELAQANSELSALQAEKATTLSTDDESMLEALKSVADIRKEEYERVNAIYASLQRGWFAQNDGIVTVVNVQAGSKFVPTDDNSSSSLDLSTLLGSNSSSNSGTMSIISGLLGDSEAVPTGVGITVESYDDMVVSVTVGKSDLLKIKVGMEANVISLGNEYKGEIIYVSATADESSGMDISSITSSIMGGSGSSNGATVKIKIKNPDEKVVIGFDVDVKIKLSTIENALKVPVEAVIYNNGTYSVYVFNEKDSTVEKRIVVKGILDDTSYQIIEGLKNGDKVVRSPDPNMEDGTKIAKKHA